MFMVTSAPISTDNDKQSSSSGTQSGSNVPTFSFSCPGPEGDNDWIRFGNYFGQAAGVAGMLSASVVLAPVTVPAAIALAALSVISAVIGLLVRGDAIEQETRQINEAEMYKFLHSAVPSDIVVAYKKYAVANVALLKQAANDVRIFLKGSPAERQQLLRKHRGEQQAQTAIGRRLADLAFAKCRINARQHLRLPTSVEVCPLAEGRAGVQQASDDQILYKNERDVLTIEFLWPFVRYRALEMLIAREKAPTQDQERLAWKQVDQSIEREFLKLMAAIDLVSDLGEIELKAISDRLTLELQLSNQYSVLRSHFSSLVGSAMKVTFGDIGRDEYISEVTRF